MNIGIFKIITGEIYIAEFSIDEEKNVVMTMPMSVYIRQSDTGNNIYDVMSAIPLYSGEEIIMKPDSIIFQTKPNPLLVRLYKSRSIEYLKSIINKMTANEIMQSNTQFSTNFPNTESKYLN